MDSRSLTQETSALNAPARYHTHIPTNPPVGRCFRLTCCASPLAERFGAMFKSLVSAGSLLSPSHKRMWLPRL